jgi:hypothetical protein
MEYKFIDLCFLFIRLFAYINSLIIMKLICLPLLLFLCLPAHAAPRKADIIADVADLIKKGDVHTLAQLFAPSVELTILDDENQYTNTQAEAALNNFFAGNKPKKVKLLHKINSNSNYLFAVLFLTTDKKVIYRIAVTLNGSPGNMKIIELRIENGKN